jgi:hypothetical protein
MIILSFVILVIIFSSRKYSLFAHFILNRYMNYITVFNLNLNPNLK